MFRGPGCGILAQKRRNEGRLAADGRLVCDIFWHFDADFPVWLPRIRDFRSGLLDSHFNGHFLRYFGQIFVDMCTILRFRNHIVVLYIYMSMYLCGKRYGYDIDN